MENHQRSQLSSSASDPSEGDRSGLVSDDHRNSDVDVDKAVTSYESDSSLFHSEFRSSLKATNESESDVESKSEISSSKMIKDTDHELADDDHLLKQGLNIVPIKLSTLMYKGKTKSKSSGSRLKCSQRVNNIKS